MAAATQPVRHLSRDDFDRAVARGVTLIDFYADWCQPCRILAPVIETVAREAHEAVTVAKVDVDREPTLAQRFEITSIPTVIVFRDGEPVEQLTGLVSGARLHEAIASAVDR